mmetsp:Transcript_20112/g.33359  ORF Transcript_20112/g.33359 Transcript_20112/m.33359 type:complete len:463 (-) Transcript_20112:441-1829(-)|eukprot:CAMPEP_0119030394 /NCGR_PEP_ID=MMETSP1176-20130426/41010_1 /TAXON_ID=265551 /ORGANISM="Synedropsis recta cf, Strain CCMP1620" /LENGTH=462 /DNA_ID=CAMNT_0006986763 /DNA_START=38 /DNA_END=1426 /DNA_ORIENTATION=+
MTDQTRFDNTKPPLSQINPKLIRQVLLTDQSQFSSLRVSDAPRFTPTLEQFEAEQIRSSSTQATMKRAFVDQLVEKKDLECLRSLVLTLHGQLRSLVPNRKDLHSFVNDEDVQSTSTPVDLLPILIRAAQGLESLESESRAETTTAWRLKAQAEQSSSAEFIVISTLYLLYKAELAQADKQDFYLQQFWAPLIHVEGPKHLRTVLDKQFGVDDYKLTKAWIKELAMHKNVQDSKERQTMIRKGWIETILFRKTTATSLPEVFALDADNLQMIRQVCKRAVACCALALHASGGNSTKLTEWIEPTSEIGLRRADLVEAMMKNCSPTYEEDVSSAVVALAKTWSSLNEETSLRSRTVAVLRGQDPVIQLLDRRMQGVFVAVVTDDDFTSAPSELRSGHAAIARNSRTDEQRKAEVAFRNKGLSFNDSELATLSIVAKKIVDLVWVLHQDVIDKAFNEAADDSVD